jgi:hypothetical protein
MSIVGLLLRILALGLDRFSTLGALERKWVADGMGTVRRYRNWASRLRSFRAAPTACGSKVGASRRFSFFENRFGETRSPGPLLPQRMRYALTARLERRLGAKGRPAAEPGPERPPLRMPFPRPEGRGFYRSAALRHFGCIVRQRARLPTKDALPALSNEALFKNHTSGAETVFLGSLRHG